MHKTAKTIKVSIIAILTVLIYLNLMLQIANSQKIALGVKTADLHLGGKNSNAAKEILENKWEEFIQKDIILNYGDSSWLVKITELGLDLNIQETIEKAYSNSHQNHGNILINIFINLKNPITSLFGFNNINPVYQIDQEEFQRKTTDLFKDNEKPAQNANLVFNPEINDYSLQHSSNGNTINREKLLNNLLNQAEAFSFDPINMELISDEPEVQNDEIEFAKEEAQKILASQPYYLTFEESQWIINKETLINWIIFEPVKEENSDNLILGLTLDYEKVKNYLSEISNNIDQPVTDAKLEILDNKATVFIPNQPGFEVKKELTFEKLVNNLLNDSPIQKTSIIADKALPNIILRQTNDLGINSLIGQGISSFAGSPNNRKHNIKTAVNQLNGYILSPEEEFSFNGFLGETGPEQGYKTELVIKKDKTTPEYGGGVCQVSTTFFRAAVNSGLKITERQHHAFPITYYSPQGFDATVYDPKPDLRFINNTPKHLLIQSYVNGNQVIVNFYGINDGRKVSIKGPYILESNEDGSMKTVLTQEVYKLSGEELEKQTFYSNYKSPDLYPIETE